MSQSTLKAGAVNNNGGTILWGGDGVNSAVTNTPGLTYVGQHSPVSGPREQLGVTKVVSAGDFATQTPGRYVIVGETDFIAGVASNLFNFPGASAGRRSINGIHTRYTSKMRTAGWNYATGEFLTTPDVVLSDFGSDVAANPTRAIPGKLVYMQGSLLPVHDNYVPLTN